MVKTLFSNAKSQPHEANSSGVVRKHESFILAQKKKWKFLGLLSGSEST